MNVKVVAYFTLKELFKSKLIHIFLAINVLFIITCYVLSEVTYAESIRMSIDFGLGISGVILVGMATFLGVTVISSELKSRNIYLVLSRAISRWEYLSGKILGFIISLTVFILMLLTSTLILYLAYGGKLESLIFVAFGGVLIEGIVVYLVATLFSLISNPIIATFLTLSYYILANYVYSIGSFHFFENFPFVRKIIDLSSFAFADLRRVNYKNFILYDIQIDSLHIFLNFCYVGIYVAGLYFLSLYIFNKKELD